MTTQLPENCGFNERNAVLVFRVENVSEMIRVLGIRDGVMQTRMMRTVKSLSQNDETRCTARTIWIGNDATLHVAIGFDFSEVNSTMLDVHCTMS